MSGFLLDASRGEVSVRTVLQVLAHWVNEGVSGRQVLDAVDVAREGCAARHRNALESYAEAITELVRR